MTNPVATVKLEQVTKRFRDFAAVSDLSLTVHPGRIYGLLAPNRAGDHDDPYDRQHYRAGHRKRCLSEC